MHTDLFFVFVLVGVIGALCIIEFYSKYRRRIDDFHELDRAHSRALIEIEDRTLLSTDQLIKTSTGYFVLRFIDSSTVEVILPLYPSQPRINEGLLGVINLFGKFVVSSDVPWKILLSTKVPGKAITIDDVHAELVKTLGPQGEVVDHLARFPR